jgi:predicted transcriptional regulator
VPPVVTLAEAIEVLQAETVVPAPEGDRELAAGFASDLMSDVLAFARQDTLLLTGLATDQTIRTAAVRHLAAVVVVADKEVSSDMLEAAREEDIPLCRTAMSKFAACGRLWEKGLSAVENGKPRDA